MNSLKKKILVNRSIIVTVLPRKGGFILKAAEVGVHL